MANELLTGKKLIEQLGKLKFFEGYTKEAQAAAEARIGEQFDKAMSGDSRKYFERFPASATASLSVYGEWDYEPFEPLVELHSDAAFGMFRPTAIKDERDEEKEKMTLSFEAGGRSYSVTADFD